MEGDGFNGKNFGQGMPPLPWPKRSLTMLSPNLTTPALAPSSYQVWKRPNHNSHHGAPSTSVAKPYLPPLDDHSKKLMINQQNPSDKDPIPTLGHGALIPTSGDKSESVPCLRFRLGRNVDPTTMDPQKLKRVISNRVSAQKSRLKKHKYVVEMEDKAKKFTGDIAVLYPQVAIYQDQAYLLQLEQKTLHEKVAAITNNKILKDAEIEERRAEVTMLRQILMMQQQKSQEQLRFLWENGLMEQMMNPNVNQPALGQMFYDMNPNQDQNGENTAEMNGLNQLNMKEQEIQNPGQVLMPSWESGMGHMSNLNLSNQVGFGQMPNLSMNNQIEIEQMSDLNSNNQAGHKQMSNTSLKNHAELEQLPNLSLKNHSGPEQLPQLSLNSHVEPEPLTNLSLNDQAESSQLENLSLNNQSEPASTDESE